MAAVGDAMLIPSGPTGFHLFIVIWGPGQIPARAHGDQLLLACVCSVDAGVPYDDACVLERGDHPFIQHQSYVAYRFLRHDSPTHVDEMLATRTWLAQDPDPALARRIRIRLCASRTVNRQFKQLLDCPPPVPSR